MSNPLKTILAIILVIAAVVVYFLLPGADPIPDNNGPDDHSLAVLTDEDICAGSFSSTAGLQTWQSSLTLPGGLYVSDGMQIYADELSGIVEILSENYILPSDFHLEIASFTIDGGNARLVVINQDEIVAEIEPGTEIVVDLSGLTGKTSLRLATESANFTLVIPGHIYDSFEHMD